MTIPTNQYEADEKFDIKEDKLEERIQKRINVIFENSDLLYDTVRLAAEQDVKNGDD